MPKIYLNLGCGPHKKASTEEIKWINIDKDRRVNPDLFLVLGKAPLPYIDNTIDFVWASHILEHIKETKDFVQLMEEIWRVCKSEAKVDIRAPYGLSEAGIADPTHERLLCAWTFKYFDKTSGYFLYDYKCNFKMISESNNGAEIHVILETVK